MDTAGRNTLIASYLLDTSIDFADRYDIYMLLFNSKLFSEYTMLCVNNTFPSVSYIQSGSVPFPHRIDEKWCATKSDVIAAFKKESDYRKKQQLIGNFYQLNVSVENDSIDTIKQRVAGILDKYTDASEFSELWTAKEAYFHQKNNPKRFFKTKISQLDELIGGIKIGTVTTVMGFAGSGKSTLSLHLAYQAIRQGLHVLVITSEVQKPDLENQFLVCHSHNMSDTSRGVKLNKIQNSELTPDEEHLLYDIVLSDLHSDACGKCIIADTSDITDYSVFGLSSFCESLSVMPDVILVDYFQRLPVEATRRDEYLFKQGQMVKAFTDMAVGNNRRSPMAVILAAQTNRGSYKDAKKSKGVYDSTGIFEVSQMEKDSHLILSTFSTAELSAKGLFGVSVVKNRTGRISHDIIEVPVDYSYCTVGDAVMSPSETTNFNLQDIL